MMPGAGRFGARRLRGGAVRALLKSGLAERKRSATEGTRLLEAVFPQPGQGAARPKAKAGSLAAETKKPRSEAQRLFEAAFPRQKTRTPARLPAVGARPPVVLQARRGGGVEALLRREIAHSAMLSARDFKRMRFLLWQVQQTARTQTPGQNKRKRKEVKWQSRALAASWHTRLQHDTQGVSLVLENRSAHALYLAMGTRYLKPRAVFKTALASQQRAIDGECRRLARLAQLRFEARAQTIASAKPQV